MTPARAYARLNNLLWNNRLPKAKIVQSDTALTSNCMGLTLTDDDALAIPHIWLNTKYKRWGKTLVHEMLHVAEPELPHGKLFDTLVNTYWRYAKQHIKGLDAV